MTLGMDDSWRLNLKTRFGSGPISGLTLGSVNPDPDSFRGNQAIPNGSFNRVQIGLDFFIRVDHFQNDRQILR
jgi:hypothetical protein